jgi:hypothetical protein
MQHAMSPTGVAVLLILALTIDWMSIGPNSVRDRLAFVMGISAVREGWNGSQLDQWTVNLFSGFIEQLKSTAGGGAYIAGATTSAVLSAAIACLSIYAVGCLLPNKLSAKAGAWAGYTFPTSPGKKINTKLWVLAIILGLLSDLAGGLVGEIVNGAIDGAAGICAGLPMTLFGVS